MLQNEVGTDTGCPIGIALLGSTGSIGRQTLEIVRLFPERLRVRSLTAHSSVGRIVEQALEFRPDRIVLVDEEAALNAKDALRDKGIRVLSGSRALEEVVSADRTDMVVTAMVGASGLGPTVAAVQAGKRIALANKETMVVAGDLINGMAEASSSDIIPVDSEHSAIFQALGGKKPISVEKLILTASGGPFRDRSGESLADVRPSEALEHPNWTMGAKITIDSATMMNKGLEVIEARWLFDLPESRIDVVIHPQSIVHSMVTFVDGSTLAQLGPPDMRVPIQVALSWPDRWEASHPRVDWSDLQTLEFMPPDMGQFPCLGLAFEALRMGGGAPAALNAANEVAVTLFLQEQISFPGIPHLVERILNGLQSVKAGTIEDRLAMDREARIHAKELAATTVHYSGPVRTARSHSG